MIPRAALTLGGLLAGAALAAAANAAPSADRAEAAIERGVRFMKGGQYEEALKEFLDAYDAAPGPRTTAQVGLAEQALERWVEAEVHLVEALAATDDRWVRKNRAVLVGCLATVRKHLGKLEVGLLGDAPAGAELRLNGDLIGVLPLPRPLTRPTGKAAIEVAAPGYLPFRRDTAIEPGQVTRVAALLARVQSEGRDAAAGAAVARIQVTAATPAPTKEAPRNLRRWAGLGLLAGGVVAAAAGGYLLAIDGDQTCNRPPCPYLYDTRLLGAVLVGAGVASAAPGLFLVVWQKPGPHSAAAASARLFIAINRTF